MAIGVSRNIALSLPLLLALPAPIASGQSPSPDKSQSAEARTSDKEDLVAGDDVVINHVSKPSKSKAKPFVRTTWVCASKTLDSYKEIDAFFGPMAKPFPNGKAVILPSGAEAVRIPVLTHALVLEVKQPDGVLNDSPAVRVLIASGPLKAEEFWVRRTRVFPRKTAVKMARLGSDPAAYLQLAQRVESHGKSETAVVVYRHIVEHYANTSSAEAARDRLEELDKKRAGKAAEAPAPSSEK
jgi:hypothetical protein